MMTFTYFIAFFFLASLVLVCVKQNGFTWWLFGMACGLSLGITVIWLLFMVLGGGSR